MAGADIYSDDPRHEIGLEGWSTSGPKGLREFEALRDELVSQWQLRATDGVKRTPQDSAIGYMKRQAYRIILHFIEAKHIRFFEHAIRREGRGLPASVKLHDNPFHYGLLALFNDDRILKRQDRSFFAQQMLYAYKHRIPPELLVGFLYQIGSNVDLRTKLRENYIEAGFWGKYRHEVNTSL